MAAGPCSTCGSVCNCRIVQCDGSAVAGAGSFVDPYVLPCETPWIGHSGDGIRVIPGDNPAGPPGNGHEPTFNLCLSDVAGNSAVIDGTGCLYVAAPTETPWTGVGTGLVVVTPGGVLGHQPTINVSCEAVQDCVGPMLDWMTGFVYNDATNRWEAAGAAGTVATTDGAGNVSFVAAGPAAVAINVQGQILPCGSSNLGVSQINNGDTVIFRGGNGINVNIFPDTFVDISVNTSGTWGVGQLNFPCASGSGAPIYCDNNVLRTVPEHTSRQGGRPANGVTTVLVGTGGTITAGTGWTVANPSLCRSMNWHAGTDYTGGSSNPVGPQGEANMTASVTLGGGPLAAFPAGTWDPLGSQGKITGGGGIYYGIADVGTIGPGAALNYAVSNTVQCVGLPAFLACSIASCGILVTQ